MIVTFLLEIKQTLFAFIEQQTEKQLTYLKEQYGIILEKLKREYDKYHKQLSTFKKNQCLK
jgi:hypothetical protein